MARRVKSPSRQQPFHRKSHGAIFLPERAQSQTFGVILPTRISPGFTSAPTRMTPSWLRSLRASSPTLGISRVISSGPSFVSRAVTSNSLDVDRGEDVVLHDLLGDQDRILEVITIPWHEGHEDVTTDCEFALYQWKHRPRGRRPS